jgi:hypothetical protein
MDNDDLGLHRQVIDFGVSTLGCSQWHGIRDIRRDSPADRPDTGNGNSRSRQDIHEHRTATHCIHEFSPLSECFFSGAARGHNTVELAWRTTAIQVARLIAKGSKPTHIQIEVTPSINRGIHPLRSWFLPINSSSTHRHHVRDRSSLVPVSPSLMQINCGQQRRRALDFTARPVPSIRAWAIACALLAVLSSAATAQARPPFRVGGLTCSTEPRVGLVLGSRQDMRCVFVANATGQQYVYRGTIRRIGVDIGVTRGGTLFWAVFARNSQIGQGTLRGNYVGASGNVALGLGLGAKVLIGGSRRTITLQPLSVEGQIGLNLALGVARLTLR